MRASRGTFLGQRGVARGGRACGACERKAIPQQGGWGASAGRNSDSGTGGGPGRRHAQELADFDSENLTFRGFGLEVGYLWPDKVEPIVTYGVRMDLGYLGPGLRVVPSITYWSSRMKAREVGELESRLDSLIAQTQPGVSSDPVTFGLIDWSDLALALDTQRCGAWRTDPSPSRAREPPSTS